MEKYDLVERAFFDADYRFVRFPCQCSIVCNLLTRKGDLRMVCSRNGICQQAPRADLQADWIAALILFHVGLHLNKEAGIEIPFAQRDAHLDTSAGPLDIRLVDKEDKR